MKPSAILLAAGVMLLVGGAARSEIRIDDTAAKAVLQALGNPQLTKAEAETVAHLPGNQAIVRKVSGSDPSASEARFADALVAAAQGDDKPTPYRFDRVKKDRLTTLKLIDDIAAHPEEFLAWIVKRITPFTPQGIEVDATGYLIAGGRADGFAFDKPDFYMNISRFGDELESARVIMVHELYHGVQSMVAVQRKAGIRAFDFDHDVYVKLPTDAVRDCYATRAYFGLLVAEGTATLVGDPTFLPRQGTYAEAERRRREGAFGSQDQQITVLEVSLKAITSPAPMGLETVYPIGFYPPAPMYDLGYVMAKAIAAHDGEVAIGRLISEPPENFVRRYIALTKENPKLQPLGPLAARWAARDTCPN